MIYRVDEEKNQYGFFNHPISGQAFVRIISGQDRDRCHGRLYAGTSLLPLSRANNANAASRRSGAALPHHLPTLPRLSHLTNMGRGCRLGISLTPQTDLGRAARHLEHLNRTNAATYTDGLLITTLRTQTGPFWFMDSLYYNDIFNVTFLLGTPLCLIQANSIL